MSRKAIFPTVLAILGSILAVRYMFHAGWTALTVLFLFWMESVTLGVVTLGKVLVALRGYHPAPGRWWVEYARGAKDVSESWSSVQPSVVSLFSLFVMYGVVVGACAFMGARLSGGDSWPALCRSLSSLREQTGGVVLVLLLDLGHQAVSAWQDFVRGPDWARDDPLFQTRGLLSRGLGLCFLVFLAGFLVGSLHWPQAFLVAFIAIKMLSDIFWINFNARVRGEWRRSLRGENARLTHE